MNKGNNTEYEPVSQSVPTGMEYWPNFLFVERKTAEASTQWANLQFCFLKCRLYNVISSADISSMGLYEGVVK
jgi:hypothetical protein